MALYESTFIARQEISEKDVEKLSDKVKQAVEGNGGKVVKSEYWGLRSLAYPINKSKKGHYSHFGIKGSPELPAAINKVYKAEEDIVRDLTISVDEISENPSPVLSNDNKSDDDFEQSF